MFLKFNYRYYFCVFYKKNLDLYLKSKIAKKTFLQALKIDDYILTNFYHTQKL